MMKCKIFEHNNVNTQFWRRGSNIGVMYVMKIKYIFFAYYEVTIRSTWSCKLFKKD